jgi:hypothetical protein
MAGAGGFSERRVWLLGRAVVGRAVFGRAVFGLRGGGDQEHRDQVLSREHDDAGDDVAGRHDWSGEDEADERAAEDARMP